MPSLFLIVAGLYGALAVGLGAAAAHGLETHLSPEAVEWVSTASRYMLAHALAVLGCATLERIAPSRFLVLAGFAFMIGIALFCGSLLTIAFMDFRAAGAIAPFGGFCLIMGWLCLSIAGYHHIKNRRD